MPENSEIHTNLRALQKCFELQRVVATILSEADELQRGLDDVLQAMSSLLSAHIGLIWLMDDEGQDLHCRAMWRDVSLDKSPAWPEFEHWCATTALPLSPSPAPAARLVEASDWLSQPTATAGAALKVDAGIQYVIVAPIATRHAHGERVQGRVEFFSQQPARPSTATVELLGDLGRQIGSFVVRQQIVERSRHTSEWVHLQERLLEAVGQAVIATRADGTIIYWNRFAEHLYGWRGTEALGRNIDEVVVSDSEAPQVESADIMTLLRQGKSWSGEFEVKRRDGSPFLAYVTDTPVHDENGNLVAIVGVSMDISERKRAEAEREQIIQELDFERARWAAVLEQMPGGVVIAAAPSGNLLLANRQFEQILRRSFMPGIVPEQYGRYQGLHPDGRPYATDEWPMTRAIRGEVITNEEMLFIADDGTRVTISASASPIRDRAGRIVAGVVSFSDITPRKQVEQALQSALDKTQALLESEARARQEAEQANSLQLKFLAMISHELRTPLTSIKGFATTLLADDVSWDPSSQREFISIINSEADTLTELIDQLLDLSRLEAGLLRMSPSVQSLGSIVSGAIPQLYTLTQAHALSIQMPDVARLPPVWADARRISQVLTNLVSNAAKYSPANTSIVVDVSLVDAACPGGARGEYVQVCVTDQGPGIPEPEWARVFKPFQRGEGSQTRNTKGTGLGLAICKGIVDAHGGQIWIEGHTGSGVTICFTVPVHGA